MNNGNGKTKLSPAKEPVSISIECWIVDLVDKVCAEQDFTRSIFFKRAVKEYLLKKISSQELWLELYQKHIEGVITENNENINS